MGSSFSRRSKPKSEVSGSAQAIKDQLGQLETLVFTPAVVNQERERSGVAGSAGPADGRHGPAELIPVKATAGWM